MASGPPVASSPRADRGHVALVLAIVTLSAWYLVDAARASPTAENLLLIAPAALLSCLLGLGILWGDLRKGSHRTENGRLAGGPDRSERQTALFMALMVLYVIGLATIPFDVATLLFAVAALFTLGERRWPFLVGFSAALTVFVMAALSLLMPGSVPMLLPL